MRVGAASICRRGEQALLSGALLLLLGIGTAGAGTRDAIGLPYQKLIERVAVEHNLDPTLLTALVEVESGRRSDAVSPRGARGLGQLMPETARRFQVADIDDPEENLRGSARYLRALISRYGGDLRLALAAYNAGEGAVDRFGGIPPFAETRSYVRDVMRRASAAEERSGGQIEGGESSPLRVVRKPNGLLLITNQP